MKSIYQMELEDKFNRKIKYREKKLKNQRMIIGKQQEEIERLNNIINELEKDFEWQLKKQADIDKFAEEQGFLNYNPVRLIVEHFKDKLQELKGSGSNE